jgi:hypothetical protein
MTVENMSDERYNLESLDFSSRSSSFTRPAHTGCESESRVGQGHDDQHLLINEENEGQNRFMKSTISGDSAYTLKRKPVPSKPEAKVVITSLPLQKHTSIFLCGRSLTGTSLLGQTGGLSSY